MFEKRENKLSKKELGVMELAREEYLSAFKQRAENPSDFDANITCLKGLAKAAHHEMTVMRPHAEKKAQAAKESRKAFLSFFRNRAKERVLEEILIMESAKNQMTNGAEAIIKEQFKTEPRISGLEFHESDLTKEDKKGHIIYEKNTYTYTITFSDNSKIILANLNTESIDEARVKFTEKMDELAVANSNVTLK